MTFYPAVSPADGRQDGRVSRIVGQVIPPVMAANAIPGMAVGIIVDGRTYIFNYGLASVTPSRPVMAHTLFEIGSISKTFTATLAAYAQIRGDLSLNAMASTYLPVLSNSGFSHVSLVELGTHTPGGLPLQVPDGINDQAQLMAYYAAWNPAYPPGTMRTYSNPGIGLLGLIVAKTMHADFTKLLQGKMFPALGLSHTFIDVPSEEMADYAEGYLDEGKEVRIQPGVVVPETAGIRTTATDLLRFLTINMGMVGIDARWQRAAVATHTGYYQMQAGGMVQDLVWEQYGLPVGLAALEAGSSGKMLLEPNSAVVLSPPMPPQADVLLNKTGSTNGFGAYVAFIPAQRIAIVLLANKNYPIPARVAAAYAILTKLGANGIIRN